MQSMDLFEGAFLLSNTAIFHQESQMEINVTAHGWLSFISFHIDTTSCKYQSKSTRKFFNSVKVFFLSIAETILTAKKKFRFHFPHNKQDEKEGQRQGRGLTLTIWEAFTLVIGLAPDKKGYLRQPSRYLK